MKVLNKLALSIILVLAACGKGEDAQNSEANGDTDQEQVNEVATTVPDLRLVALSSIGNDGATLTADEDECAHLERFGLFGVALGHACHLGPVVGDFLFGKGDPDRNGNDKLDCGDYQPGRDDQGLMFGLMCERVLQQRNYVESVRFREDDESIAISFEDYDDTDEFDAVGTWSASLGDDQRYPANIQVYTDEATDEITGVIALAMQQAARGNMKVDMRPIGYDGRLDIAFAGPEQVDPEACLADPSDETCGYQTISAKGQETPLPGAMVPGIALKVMAEKKIEPEMVVIEGKIRLNKAWAKFWFEDVDQAFSETRSIYFQTVVRNGQIWGRYTFKNRDGEDLAVSEDNASVLDNLLHVDGGFCVDASTAAEKTCELGLDQYKGIWIGEDSMTAPEADFDLGHEFTEPPAQDGFILK